MNPLLHKVQALRLRPRLPLAPSGTPSRILSTRLKRFSRLHSVRSPQEQCSPEKVASQVASQPQLYLSWDFNNNTGLSSRSPPSAQDGFVDVWPPAAAPPLPSLVDLQPPNSSPLSDIVVDDVSSVVPRQLHHWQRSNSQLSWNQSTDPESALASLPSLDKLVLRLLHAVQTQDAPRAYTPLLQLLASVPPTSPEAAMILAAVPRNTITEIFQTLDPIEAGPQIDCVHGMRLPEHLQALSPITSALDKLGIRKVYKDLFAALLALSDLMLRNGYTLTAPEYLVLLRCAGATSDPMAAKRIWKMMDDREMTDVRTAQGYNEFLKSRFVTEPLYLQHDLARGRLRPLNLSSSAKVNRLRPVARQRLDNMRLYRARGRRSQYGQSPHEPERDLNRTIATSRVLKRLWRGLIKLGTNPDHRLWCTYLIACGRVGNIFSIKTSLVNDLGLHFSDADDHRATEVSGGRNHPIGSSFAPTPQLLHAIIHSLGSVGYVLLARKVIEYLSQRYALPIPATVWSDLLELTYISSTHQVKKEWALFEQNTIPNRDIQAQDVINVWDSMVSEPHNVQPTMDDLDKCVNALIQAQRFDDARDAMRMASGHYHELVQGVHEALSECLYPLPLPSSTNVYLKTKAQQHRAWSAIQNWCERWVRHISKIGKEDESVSSRVIPEFLEEFKEFMPKPALYHTPAGLVRLSEDGGKAKFWWQNQVVESMPTMALRRHKHYPVLREDGTQHLNDYDQPLYHRKNLVFSQAFQRGVRVRREQTWELHGVFRYCVPRKRGKDGLPSLSVNHMADCVEW